jgi:predicted glycoside hydrolase/deacetylase ChbG (UPF0249 family)
MKEPNPVLRKLGFKDNDRLAIIHTDDIGMCQASIAAFSDLAEVGIISCGAVMVPCPWFLETADYCRKHPAVDMGVHLTLTCEYRTYRWGPISTRNPASGMMDNEGFFYHRSVDMQEHGDPEAVQVELATQVERALRAGISVSHVDTHMGTVAHPKFMMSYIQLAMMHHIPAMIFRMDEDGWKASGMDGEMSGMAAHAVQQLEEMGLPLLDGMASLPLDDPRERLDQAKQAFAALQPGITHFIIHPSKDTPELRAIAPDWSSRVEDYQTFMKPELGEYLNQIGVHVIGYHHLKELIPEQ